MCLCCSLLGSSSLLLGRSCGGGLLDRFLFGTFTLTLTRWTCWTGWTGWTLWTGWTFSTSTSTTFSNSQKKIIEASLVKASATHFLLNFISQRLHYIIYKRKIIFIPNDHRGSST